MKNLFTASFQELFLINILLLLPLVMFGYIFSIMKRRCNRNLRRSIGYFATLFFGIVGVPIHELSHLLMCILFRHKITEVNLFRPMKGRYDNILGYVKHKYNTNNIYQVAGCFFIGIAPMVFGSFMIVFIINLMFPDIIDNLMAFSKLENLQLNHLVYTIYYNTKLIVVTLFSPVNFTKPLYWLSLYLIVSISLHMTISKADFDHALNGFVLLEIIIFIYTLIHIIFDFKAIPMLSYTKQISSILLSVLFIAFLMFGIVYLISYLIYRIVH